MLKAYISKVRDPGAERRLAWTYIVFNDAGYPVGAGGMPTWYGAMAMVSTWFRQ